jgi:hypothetical protein
VPVEDGGGARMSLAHTGKEVGGENHAYRDELIESNGAIGKLLNKLFVRSMGQQVHRFSGFLIRDEARRTVEELSWGFYDDCGRQIFIKILTGFLPDDAAAERYIAKSMRHWLINEFKKTPDGKIYDLLTHRMNRDQQHRFVHIHGTRRWGLAGGSTNPSKATVEQMAVIARTCTITMTRSRRSLQRDHQEWSAEPVKHRAPNVGKQGELENMLETIFIQTHGTIEMMDLVRVIKIRVPQVATPEVISLEEIGGADARELRSWPTMLT